MKNQYLERAKQEIENNWSPGAFYWIDKNYPDEYDKVTYALENALIRWNGSQYDPEFWAAVRDYKETLISYFKKYKKIAQ